MKNILLLVSILAFTACASTGKKTANLPYSEFKKILSPRAVVPISTTESLALIKMPKDKYAKIYMLDHTTKKFTEQMDYGRNISVLHTDPWNKNMYVYIDGNGDENFGIYLYDIQSKKVSPLFVNEGFQATIPSFSKNKDHLFIRSNHEDKKTYSIYKVDIASREATKLTKGEKSWDAALVSPDERTVALTQQKGNGESHLYILKTKTGKIYRVFKRDKTLYSPAFFHPSKNYLYLNSDHKRDRRGCAYISLKNPSKLGWMLTDNKKDISCRYNKLAKATEVIESHSGQRNVRILKGVFGKELETPIPDKVLASSIAVLPDSKTAFVKLLKSDSPGDFYMFDLSKGKDAELTPITQTNQSKISNENFAKSYDFNYKSFDGKEIHSIIFAKKEWLESDTKRPVILWPHGGPDSHMTHRYSSLFQYWALNGYVVFAPNFRGSTGFGKKFETLNDKDWGGGHIKDLVWGKRALSKLGYINPERMFIVGASFGGFSTLSAITRHPKEFNGAVAMLAISNLFTFLKSIPPDPAWQSEFLTEMGDPEKDKALYEERSPYFHADKVAIPLKIYQAENDTRTVLGEMNQFVDKLNELNIPVEYVVLKKEGHGFSREESARKAFQGTIEFLNTVNK